MVLCVVETTHADIAGVGTCGFAVSVLFFLIFCGTVEVLGWTVVVVSTCKHLPMLLTLVY